MSPASLSTDPPGLPAWEIGFGGERVAPIGGEGRAGLRLPLGRLAGEAAERLFGAARPAGESEGFRLYSTGDFLLGWSFEPVAAGGAESAAALYRRLLRAAEGRFLCRIWNHVPAINRWDSGTENYRSFSAGRARAFEEAFGAGYMARLPAASAVGCGGDELVAVFAAAGSPPRHFENPEQWPAYRYPPEHGPRSPSFARATVAQTPSGTAAFISGTAAIKGHSSVAAGSFAAQLDCTLDNLRLISEAAGLGARLDLPKGANRHFRIYLRRRADLAAAERRLSRELLRPGDRAVWLQADLCRAELDVEIEATLIGAMPDQEAKPRPSVSATIGRMGASRDEAS